MKPDALLYLLCILLSASCNSLRQEVEPKGIVQEPEKLVVACFISPQDTVLAALVTRSSPVLGTAKPFNSDVTNATVTLSDGSQSVMLRIKAGTIYGNVYNTYRADPRELPIVAGKTYTLTVRVPDGRQVTATCTVPRPVALEQVVLDSAISDDLGSRGKNYYASLRWHDPAGQTNFYRVAGSNEYPYTYRVWTSPNSSARDTVVHFRGDWYFRKGSILTDLGRDGQEIISQRGRLAPSTMTLVNGVWMSTRPSGQLNAHLLHVDENYYRYHDAVERQNQLNENPFAEPVLIPSNIQGGLGCFGAYNRSTITIQIK